MTMTLEDIKNALSNICLSHKEIQGFNYGEEFIIDDINEGRIQQAFLEIPYVINFDSDERFKYFQFALLVLFPSSSLVDDHQSISKCETIADAIITKFKKDHKRQLTIDSVNGISVRNISDSDLSGVRMDMTIRVHRDQCIDTQFD